MLTANRTMAEPWPNLRGSEGRFKRLFGYELHGKRYVEHRTKTEPGECRVVPLEFSLLNSVQTRQSNSDNDPLSNSQLQSPLNPL